MNANEIEIEVRLFGAFRDLVPGASLTFNVPSNATAVMVKDRIGAEFKAQGTAYDAQLLKVSALATPDRVLGENERIDDDSMFALLPPVSGG